MKTKKTIKGFNAGKYSIFFVLLFMIFISSLLNKNFLSAGNMTNVARQLAVGTILAYGEMILIISGMLDLSAGSVLALSGLLSVGFYKNTYETMGVYPALTIAFFLSVFIAVLCNLFNAVLVTNLHVPSFIATLSMQTIARGIALLYTKGQNILQIGDYKIIGQGQIWVIPIPIIILAIITIIMWYTLKHTRFGRSLYAIGGNEEASIASGINVNACKYKAFIFNGVLVGIAGVLFMSRVNAGLPNGAIGYEMEGLTAAIVGGTSFSGGVGTTGGTLAGSFIIGFLNNIMNLSGVDSYVQQIVRGLLIALAVVYDVRFKSKRVNRVILVEDEEEETAKKSAI
ncbi:MAG: ABC transporter permease [Smithella sp.]